NGADAICRKTRQGAAHHEVEMVGFAKEVSLIGRDAIDEMDRLSLEAVTLEEVIAIVVERCRTCVPQPFPKAPFEHGPLCWRHFNAAIVINELGQYFEIAGRETISERFNTR